MTLAGNNIGTLTFSILCQKHNLQGMSEDDVVASQPPGQNHQQAAWYSTEQDIEPVCVRGRGLRLDGGGQDPWKPPICFLPRGLSSLHLYGTRGSQFPDTIWTENQRRHTHGLLEFSWPFIAPEELSPQGDQQPSMLAQRLKASAQNVCICESQQKTLIIYQLKVRNWFAATACWCLAVSKLLSHNHLTSSNTHIKSSTGKQN